eukprot:2046092-Amphidinium_carterae.1
MIQTKERHIHHVKVMICQACCWQSTFIGGTVVVCCASPCLMHYLQQWGLFEYLLVMIKRTAVFVKS